MRVDARTAADLLAVVHRWHGEGRTMVAVLHDLELVRREFPETLLLARDCLGWGPTGEVLTAANRLRARMMARRAEPRTSAAPALPIRVGDGDRSLEPRGRPAARGSASLLLIAPSSNSASCAGRWSAASPCRSPAPPLGVFLMLRRMSLTADVLAHGILPGVAGAFLMAGLSLPAMALGGLAGRAGGRGRRRRAVPRHRAGGRTRRSPRSTWWPWRWASPWSPGAAGRWN